jgi:hypothetical protein
MDVRRRAIKFKHTTGHSYLNDVRIRTMALTVGLRALDQRLNAFLQGADAVASECASLEDIWNSAQAEIMRDDKAQQFRIEQGTNACYSRQSTDSHRVLAVFLDTLLRCAIWPIIRQNMLESLHDLFEYEMKSRDSLVRTYVRLFLEAARTEMSADTDELRSQILTLACAVVDELFTVFPDQRDLAYMQPHLHDLKPDYTLKRSLANAISMCDPTFAYQERVQYDRAVNGDTLKYADSRQNDEFYNEWGR